MQGKKILYLPKAFQLLEQGSGFYPVVSWAQRKAEGETPALTRGRQAVECTQS